jgi:hypothetical protein
LAVVEAQLVAVDLTLVAQGFQKVALMMAAFFNSFFLYF